MCDSWLYHFEAWRSPRSIALKGANHGHNITGSIIFVRKIAENAHSTHRFLHALLLLPKKIHKSTRLGPSSEKVQNLKKAGCGGFREKTVFFIFGQNPEIFGVFQEKYFFRCENLL